MRMVEKGELMMKAHLLAESGKKAMPAIASLKCAGL